MEPWASEHAGRKDGGASPHGSFHDFLQPRAKLSIRDKTFFDSPEAVAGRCYKTLK